MNNTNDNLILDMPFDESAGSKIAYDYSKSKANGKIEGLANFVQGKDGKALSFKGGEDKCVIDKDFFKKSEFTITFLVFIDNVLKSGAINNISWLLNFEGVDNYTEVAINVPYNKWNQISITRVGSTYKIYLNSALIKSITSSSTLMGLSLNQSYYGSDNAYCLLDTLKIYDKALAQKDIEDTLRENEDVDYYMDGINFKDYGVYVSSSLGILDLPALKEPLSVNWDNYHGEAVDLNHKFYQPRDIKLNCFIKANGKMDFVQKVREFEQQFAKNGTHRLTISIHPTKPLAYEVYQSSAIEINKTWDNRLMVGTFQLSLREPDPVKRLLRFLALTPKDKCSIKIDTLKMVSIYWGDGSVDHDVSGDIEVSHTYNEAGEYYVIIAGCIDEIRSFETNSIIVWDKF